jgi:hypothetical protein
LLSGTVVGTVAASDSFADVDVADDAHEKADGDGNEYHQ